ncbi:hypothetical protein ACWEIJ_14235 [Lentzea sp. NPDC004789]
MSISTSAGGAEIGRRGRPRVVRPDVSCPDQDARRGAAEVDRTQVAHAEREVPDGQQVPFARNAPWPRSIVKWRVQVAVDR